MGRAGTSKSAVSYTAGAVDFTAPAPVKAPMPTGADPHKPIHVLGAGLSGLSAAIVLAQAGREVHVHELRADSGARFAGDFQAIENWSHPVDFLDEMRGWGLDPGTFQTTPFRQMDLVLPRGEIVTARTPGI